MGRALEGLDSRRSYWAPAVIAPERDWSAMPGCRRGARSLVHEFSCRPSRDSFACFESRAECLQWIMAHRADLTRSLPGAQVRPVNLARWMLGLD